jgi:hypothetical protein
MRAGCWLQLCAHEGFYSIGGSLVAGRGVAEQERNCACGLLAAVEDFRELQHSAEFSVCFDRSEDDA